MGEPIHSTEPGLSTNGRDFLVFHWLRLRAPWCKRPGFIPDQGTKAHTLQLKTPHTVKLPRAKNTFLFFSIKDSKGRAALEGAREPVKDGHLGHTFLQASAREPPPQRESASSCVGWLRRTQNAEDTRHSQGWNSGRVACAEQGKCSRDAFSQPSPGGWQSGVDIQPGKTWSHNLWRGRIFLGSEPDVRGAGQNTLPVEPHYSLLSCWLLLAHLLYQ